MMRRLAAVAASMGVLFASASAHAQTRSNFGQQGQFILGADRLFSLFQYTHTSQDAFPSQVPAGDSKVNTTHNETSMSLLWGSTGPSVETFYTVPRVGFDYVLLPQFTIGGEIVVFFTLGTSQSTTATANNGGTTTNNNDDPGGFVFGIAPRAGYILPLNDMFGFWLRGGVSYYLLNTKQSAGAGNNQTTTINSVNQFALDLDPQFVITPVPHLGFTAGITADIPLAGGHSIEIDRAGASQSQSAWSGIMFIGVTVGMLGYF